MSERSLFVSGFLLPSLRLGFAVAMMCVCVLSETRAQTPIRPKPSVAQDLLSPADRQLVKVLHESVRSPRALFVWVDSQPPRLAIALSSGKHLVQVRLTNDEGFAAPPAPNRRAPDQVQGFRQRAFQAGMGGRVTADWMTDEKLNYADRSVNCIVIATKASPAILQSAVEALQPGGSLWLRADVNSKTSLPPSIGADSIQESKHPDWHWAVKPRDSRLDSWSHVRHGADHNPVSADKLVAEPRNIRWVGGNLWPRGYRRAAVPAVTIGQRQMVYVLQDEVPTADGLHRQDSLVARDAFNGLPLWKTRAESYRLVTSGERLFTVRNAKVVERSARTGEIVREFPTPVPRELAVVRKRLVVQSADRVSAWDIDHGEQAWEFVGATSQIVCDEQRCYALIDRSRRGGASVLTALDLDRGDVAWEKTTNEMDEQGVKLVLAYEGVLVFAGSDGNHIVDAETGEHLWSHDYTRIGHGGSYEKVLGLDQLIWVHEAKSKRNATNSWAGLALRTGKRQRVLAQPVDFHSKHRCSFDVATSKHLLCGSMDFADLATGEYTHFGAARNSCAAAGVVPANGLVYSFPHACGCYPMLRGLLALDGDRALDARGVDEAPANSLLERGPAWPTNGGPSSANAPNATLTSAWHTYRGNAARGAAASQGPRGLSVRWAKPIVTEDLEDPLVWEWRQRESSRLSQAVGGGRQCIIADGDGNRVVALDVSDGSLVWQHVAASRIEGPPTVAGTWCLFGTRGGRLICLRASDGALAWRTEVVGGSRRIAAHGQVESANPIRGATLVLDGNVYVVTGRHDQEGRGLWVHAFRVTDGKVLWRRPVDDQQVPDVLVARDGWLQMGQWHTVLAESSLKSNSPEPAIPAVPAIAGKWSPMIRGGKLGLQDNTWYRRPIAMRKNIQAWTLLPDLRGQLLAFDGQRSYSYQAAEKVLGANGMLFGNGSIRGAAGRVYDPWSVAVANASRISGMLLAGDSLYVAGEFQDSLFSTSKRELRRYDATNGRKLEHLPIAARPVHDGISSIEGMIFLSLINGQVVAVHGDTK